MNAIALNSSVSNLAKILGPSLGGVLISIIGVAGCLFVNAVSFLAIIGTLVIMKFPSLSSKTGEEAPFWEEVLEGYRFLRGQRRLFSIILLSYGGGAARGAVFAFSPRVCHRRAARRPIHVRFAISGSGHRRGRRGAGHRVAGEASAPAAFRCHERLCVFVILDCLFLLPFTAVIDVAADPRRRQQYRDSRRSQFDHTTGNAGSLIGPHIEPIFHGQGTVVVRHAIHRQRRPFCRDPEGYRDFRGLLRRSGLAVSLPAETGAGNAARGGCKPAGKRTMKGDRDDGDTYWNRPSQVELRLPRRCRRRFMPSVLESSRREDADIKRNFTAANYGLG
jgi:Transmembrane secretion effector